MQTWINGELLDENEMLAEEQTILPRLIEAMQGESRSAILARAREWARENVIDKILLRQAERGEPGITMRLTAKLVPPKATELTDYYRRNSGQFYAPDMVHAAHIVCNVDAKTSDGQARARIDQAAQRLANGEDFPTVADSMSDCPGRGGDLGFFPRGQMVAEFEDVVFNLRPGEVSGAFRTPFGYHIARVIAVRAGGVPSFDEVREQVANVVYTQKKQRAIDQYVDRLRAKAIIEHS
jgi:parvulin-like peptidyl-prolyl isomerase